MVTVALRVLTLSPSLVPPLLALLCDIGNFLDLSESGLSLSEIGMTCGTPPPRVMRLSVAWYSA